MRTAKWPTGYLVALATAASLALALTACGGDGDGGDVSDATGTARGRPAVDATMTTGADAIEPTVLELVFDGDDCTYEGPSELEVGPVALVFINDSEGQASANMASIDEGYTLQDVIDDIGEDGSYSHAPPWTTDVVGVWSTTEPGDSHRWEWDIDPGRYAMVCAHISPPGVWFGSGLTVEA